MSAQPANTTAFIDDLSELFDHAEFGLVIIDRDGHILSVNQQLLNLFQCPRQALLGHSARLFWQAFRQEQKFQDFQLALAQGHNWRGELLCKSVQGKIFPVGCHWYPHPRDPDVIVGLLNDLSEQRRWESELLESKERAERYLDISQAMILSLDPAGRIVEINRRGCEILGYPPEQLWQQNWFDIALPAAARIAAKETHQRLMAGLQAPENDVETEIISASGEQRVILWHHSLTTDEHGQTLGMLSSGQDISQRKAAEEEVMRIAMTDSLTGLLNRRSFHQRFRETLHLAVRHGLGLSIVAIDLDHFKPVNDSFGHEMGDRVLQRVAEILRENLRESDTIVRLGGDEFAVVALHPVTESPEPMLRRLLNQLNAPMALLGQRIQISASMGIAQFPAHGSDPDQLLRQADSALYQAKNQGRNRIAYPVDPEDPQRAIRAEH